MIGENFKNYGVVGIVSCNYSSPEEYLLKKKEAVEKFNNGF